MASGHEETMASTDAVCIVITSGLCLQADDSLPDHHHVLWCYGSNTADTYAMM